MSTSATTIDALLRSLAPLDLQARKMFGEYGLYLGGKLVGLVADDQVYVKVTEAGRAFLDDSNLAPPYPGAKPSFLVPERQAVDARWMTALLTATEAALPLPPPKKPKKRG